LPLPRPNIAQAPTPITTSAAARPTHLRAPPFGGTGATVGAGIAGFDGRLRCGGGGGVMPRGRGGTEVGGVVRAFGGAGGAVGGTGVEARIGVGESVISCDATLGEIGSSGVDGRCGAGGGGGGGGSFVAGIGVVGAEVAAAETGVLDFTGAPAVGGGVANFGTGESGVCGEGPSGAAPARGNLLICLRDRAVGGRVPIPSIRFS